MFQESGLHFGSSVCHDCSPALKVGYRGPASGSFVPPVILNLQSELQPRVKLSVSRTGPEGIRMLQSSRAEKTHVLEAPGGHGAAQFIESTNYFSHNHSPCKVFPGIHKAAFAPERWVGGVNVGQDAQENVLGVHRPPSGTQG